MRDCVTRMSNGVCSFYVEHLSAASQGKYVFAYQVEITNEGKEAVQLKNRSWTIVDGRGNTEYAKYTFLSLDLPWT